MKTKNPEIKTSEGTIGESANSAARYTEWLNIASATGESLINAALAAEITANLASTTAVGVAGGLTFVAYGLGLAVAGREEIKRTREKVLRRLERIKYLQGLNDLEPQAKWNEILNYFAVERAEAVTARKAKAEILPVVLSSGSVGLSVLGFMAWPLKIFTQIAPRAMIGIGAAFSFLEGAIAYVRGRKQQKLQQCAQALKDIEIELLRQAYSAVHVALVFSREKNQQPEAYNAEDGAKIDPVAQTAAIFSAFDSENTILDASIKKKIRAAESLVGDRVWSFIIAGIFTSITGAALLAIVSTIAGIAIAAFPPILLLGLAVAAVAVGGLIYSYVAEKLITAAHHCLNKVRALFGLDVIDGNKSGLSASTAIVVIGAFLGILSLLTFPIVGLLTAGIVGGCLTALHLFAAWRINKRDVARSNLVKEVKLATCKGGGTASMITRTLDAAAKPKSGAAPAPVNDQVKAVKTASLSQHFTADEKSKKVDRVSFFAVKPKPIAAAKDEEFMDRKFALGC